jgi:hypothetical protein
MNILVSFLRGHREAVDLLTRGEQSSLLDVVGAKEGFEFPFALDREIADALIRGQPNGHLLREAYLPVIERDDWERQLRSAAPADHVERVPFAVSEHVTMVPSLTSTRGVTLPDDDDLASMRLSFFGRWRDSRLRVSIEYASGPGLPTGLAVTLAVACSLPDRGECDAGECGGDCERKRVHNDDDGLVCRCPHEQ